MVLTYLVVLMITKQEDQLRLEETSEAAMLAEDDVVSTQYFTEWDELTTIQLKDSVELVANQEKKANFAHYLSNQYRADGHIDSAAYFDGLAAKSFPNEENMLIAGTEYFDAFSVAVNETQASYLNKKSTDYLTQVLNLTPEHEGAKTMLAILALAKDDRQKGIDLLREVLSKNPDNIDARFNLGVVALQAGDFMTASQQFEKIIALDTAQAGSYFYLALCYKELGRNEEAKAMFEKVKELDSSPEVQADVDSYLDEIK